MLVDQGVAEVYDFSTNEVPGATDRDRGYWRDVGSIDSYYEASMDIVSIHPIFNLYNRQWPILTWNEPRPPGKFVFNQPGRMGYAVDSLVSDGAIVSGGYVGQSVISPGGFVHSYAEVEGSVLMHDVEVGRHAIVRNAIIDKNVKIPEGARIGVDLELDRARFAVSPNGIVVIGKRQKVQ
jgi:glucose-1-phosphate adenylyltransferase